MKTPINFAVIGCGALARGQHLPNIVASLRLKLHTCCDVSEDSLQFCRENYKPVRTTTDYKAAIRDPDVQVVCIATTEKWRLPLIEEAAAAGKPVYCEKPLAATLKEMYAIRQVVKQSGIPFCVGHNRRAAPAMVDARRIFHAHMTNPKPCPWRWDREGANRPKLPEDGAPAVAVRINDDWYSWKAWVFDKSESAGSPMIWEMTHFTDMCNWFLAREPEEVVAIEAGLLNHGVVVHYQGHALATISISDNGTLGYPKELYEFMGNGGIVVVDHMVEVRTAGIEGAPAKTTYPVIRDRFPAVGTEGGVAGWLAKRRAAAEDAVRHGDNTRVFCCEPDKGHAAMLERFVDEVFGNGPAVCGVDDAVKATEIGFAALKASHERRAVKIEEIRQPR